jgi:hypothetical protein
MVCQCILVYGSVGNHQNIWKYDYDYDYVQMFWSHTQLQNILQLRMTPESLMVPQLGSGIAQGTLYISNFKVSMNNIKT